MPRVTNPWAWFKGLFARRSEDPRMQQRTVLPYPVAGVMLTPDECLSLGAVWACISVVATSIASCRWNIYRPIGPNRRQLLQDDPLHWVLNTRPNPDMTAIGFREALLMVALPFGNSYAEIVRDGAGRPARLWPLEPYRVQPRRVIETDELVYDHLQADGTTVTLPQRDVFHLRGPGLHGLMGENVIARAAKSLAVAAAQERFSASFFGQGANPGGVLENASPKVMTEEQYTRLMNDWAEKKKGPENAHKPMILEDGWHWQGSTVDPQKSQLIEGKQFSVEEICRWFGVPPHKVQHLTRSTLNNIEHQSIEFVRDALTPWCRRIEQEGDYKLIGQKPGVSSQRWCEIDTAPLTAGDAKTRAEAYGLLRQNGIITANEARAHERMNDAGPDGDVMLVQSNLTTVERLVNPPEPVAPALPPGSTPAPAPNDPNTDDSEIDVSAAGVAREAFTIIMAGALERYARRLVNRRADLERAKRAPDQVETELASERVKLRPRLAAELEPAAHLAARALGRPLVPADLQRAVELVDAGAAPAAAVLKALPATCPQAG